MFVWELVSARLRADGWDVWHATEAAGPSGEPTYRVHVRRPGLSDTATAPTLTEAYAAAAARRAREHAGRGRTLAAVGG